MSLAATPAVKNAVTPCKCSPDDTHRSSPSSGGETSRFCIAWTTPKKGVIVLREGQSVESSAHGGDRPRQNTADFFYHYLAQYDATSAPAGTVVAETPLCSPIAHPLRPDVTAANAGPRLSLSQALLASHSSSVDSGSNSRSRSRRGSRYDLQEKEGLASRILREGSTGTCSDGDGDSVDEDAACGQSSSDLHLYKRRAAAYRRTVNEQHQVIMELDALLEDSEAIIRKLRRRVVTLERGSVAAGLKEDRGPRTFQERSVNITPEAIYRRAKRNI